MAEVHYGKSPNTVLTEESHLPIIGAGGIYGRASRAMYNGPAVVVPRKGSLGNPQYVDEPFWPVDTTYAVIPKTWVDAKWLYYSLDAFDLTKLNEATGVPSISRDWLYKVLVGSEEYGEQRRIAEILSTVDEAIEQTEALIAKYRKIKTGLMHDLFTPGLSPEASAKGGVTWKLRPTRAEAPHLYKASPLGWIPKEWEVSTLRELCEWFSGGTPSRNKAEWWNGDFPWLTPKDMKAFELSDTSEHITKEAALMGSRSVGAGAVFIVVRGMILAHSFPVVLGLKDFAFNQDIKAIQPGNHLSNRFLAYWFVGHRDLFFKKLPKPLTGRSGSIFKKSASFQSACQRWTNRMRWFRSLTPFRPESNSSMRWSPSFVSKNRASCTTS
ncbi:MAG: restriction endonuclease subunit S [Nitrospira sp.]|nr:restriction endonuclease subunit S [Nitrospira sp.]